MSWGLLGSTILASFPALGSISRSNPLETIDPYSWAPDPPCTLAATASGTVLDKDVVKYITVLAEGYAGDLCSDLEVLPHARSLSLSLSLSQTRSLCLSVSIILSRWLLPLHQPSRHPPPAM